MDEKIKIRLAVGKEYANYFYHHYYDLLRPSRVVKSNLKYIITSFYHITDVFK